MKVQVLSVGRLKTGSEKDMAQDYLDRIESIGRKAGVSKLDAIEIAESKAAEAPRRMAEEADAIAAKIPQGAFRVVLDERGKALSSADFAQMIRKHASAGTPALSFLIGGPDGHSPQMREKADLLLSFGPATWPHRLVRVMLLEQIYRAVTIMVNHPYHRP